MRKFARRLVPIVLTGIAVALTGVAPAGADKSGAAILTADTVTFVIQYPGRGIIYTGGDHANDVSVDISGTDIVLQDPDAVDLSTSSPCVLTNSTTVTCPKNVGSGDTDKVFSVSVLGNGGADQLTSVGSSWVSGSTFNPIAVTLSGGSGNDSIVATGGYSKLVGGLGDDYLVSGPGTTTGLAPMDKIWGSEGNDTIHTAAGTGSADDDGIYCDTQYDQSYTDTLTRGSNDIEYSYFALPTPIPGGCDNVTIE